MFTGQMFVTGIPEDGEFMSVRDQFCSSDIRDYTGELLFAYRDNLGFLTDQAFCYFLDLILDDIEKKMTSDREYSLEFFNAIYRLYQDVPSDLCKESSHRRLMDLHSRLGGSEYFGEV